MPGRPLTRDEFEGVLRRFLGRATTTEQLSAGLDRSGPRSRTLWGGQRELLA